MLILLSAGGSILLSSDPDPSGVRLDLSSEGSYVVRWSNQGPAAFADEVEYGPADGSWSRVATGSSRVLPAWATSFAWLRAVRLHEVTLPPLPPGDYRYRVDGEPERSFRVPPAERARVVALADVGASREAADAIAVAASFEPHLAIVAGDLAYADGDVEAWLRWLDLVEPLASRAPLLPARGNHEVEPPWGSRHFRAFFPESTSYYSRDVAGAHFVFLDTSLSLSESRPARGARAAAAEERQEAWLRADLAAARAAGASWIVAVLHEPAYSTGPVHGSNAAVAARWTPIFDEHGVDLVLQGHDHNYQRSHPLKAGAIDPEGTVYVVTGGGGRRLYAPFNEPAPGWMAFRAATHEILVLDVDDEAIAARAVRLDGAVLDAFTLYR